MVDMAAMMHGMASYITKPLGAPFRAIQENRRWKEMAASIPPPEPPVPPEPLWFTPPKPEPEEPKGIIEKLVDKIASKPLPEPNIIEGRSFPLGHIYSEEEIAWLRKWHAYEIESKKPGHDQREMFKIALDQSSEMYFLKKHAPDYAGHLQTLAARGADPVKLKEMMDQKIAQLKRQHRLLTDDELW